MNDHINPALRERLETRRQTGRVAVVREQRAQQPYRHTHGDRRFLVAYWVIALAVAGIIGELVH